MIFKHEALKLRKFQSRMIKLNFGLADCKIYNKTKGSKSLSLPHKKKPPRTGDFSIKN